MIVGWDFETHRIRPGMIAPRPVCMSVHESLLGISREPVALARRQAGPVLAAHLRRAARGEIQLVGHNTAYDLVCAAAEWPELMRDIMDGVDSGGVRCTLIRQLLLDIAAGEAEFRRRLAAPVPADAVVSSPYATQPGERRVVVSRAGRALDDLVDLYFGEVLPKDQEIRTGFGALDGLPVDAYPLRYLEYMLRDAVEPSRVFLAQEERALALSQRPDMEGVWETVEGETIPDERPQTRKAVWLQLMSAWGLRTDPEAATRLRVQHETSQATIKARLRMGPHPSWAPEPCMREDGSRDMKMIQARVEYAYAARGAQTPRTNPSGKFPDGQIKADTETLVDSGDEELAMLGESLSDASTIGTWLPWLELGATTPICVGYEPVKETGRTSARKPNIQNPPRKGDIRACFVPREGWVYSFADYDTAELRALAQVCTWLLGWSDLGDALKEGLDPHLALAAEILGIGYEEALQRYEAGDPEVAEARQLCKVANFGYPGGLGPEKFIMYAHGYDPKFKALVDIKVSRRLRDAWFRRWREMRKFFECVSAAIGPEGEGAIQQFASRRVRGGCGFTQAANTTFQGLVADGANRAGWALARECYLGDWIHPPEGDDELELHRNGAPSPLLGARPVLFMHDEFGLEIPYLNARGASLAADRQARVQRLSMQEVIPDVPIKCGAVMTRRWFKGAKAVRVGGVMVPSRPEKRDGNTVWVPDEGGMRIAA